MTTAVEHIYYFEENPRSVEDDSKQIKLEDKRSSLDHDDDNNDDDNVDDGYLKKRSDGTLSVMVGDDGVINVETNVHLEYVIIQVDPNIQRVVFILS